MSALPTDRQTKNELSVVERTAYHEAGHVVAAYIVAEPFKEVSIIPDEKANTLGHVSYCKWTQKAVETAAISGASLENYRARRLIERRIITAFGGIAAVEILDPSSTHGWSFGDLQSIYGCAGSLCASPEEGEAYLNWLQVRTKTQLAFPWHLEMVKVLAGALVQHQRLSYRQACEIMQEAKMAYLSAVARTAGTPQRTHWTEPLTLHEKFSLRHTQGFGRFGHFGRFGQSF